MKTSPCTNHSLLSAAGAIASLPALLLLASPVGAQTTTVLGVTLDRPPDMDGFLNTFGTPALNDLGQAVFEVELSAASSGSTRIYRGDGVGPLVEIVRKGGGVPEGNGAFNFFSAPAINNAGQVVFSSILTGTSGGSADNNGTYRGDGTSMVKLVREGDADPSATGTFDEFFGAPGINTPGQGSYRADLAIPGSMGFDDSGIFRSDGTTNIFIVREDDSAPTGGGEFDGFSDTAVNESGQVAFRADLRNTTDDSGIFRGDGTTLVQVARKNGLLPDTVGTFTLFENPAINDEGDVSFRSSFSSTGAGGPTNSSGVFVGDGTTLSEIARTGDAPPEGDGTFSDFGSDHVVVNNNGVVAFVGFLAGTSMGSANDEALYKSDGTTTTKIAREGDPAPDGNGVLARPRFIGFNDAGQAAFTAQITGTSGGFNDNEGIFFHDDTLGVLQVVRKGDMLAGGTISLLLATGGPSFESNEWNGFNSSGQVAFYFFTGSKEGVAIWTPPTPAVVTVTVTSTIGGPGGFTVNWTTSPPDSGIDIYRSTDLVSWTGPLSTNDTDGTFTDVAAPAATAYYAMVPTGTTFP